MPVTKTLFPHEVSQELHIRPSHPYDPSQEDLHFSWSEQVGDDAEVTRLLLTGTDRTWRMLRMGLSVDLPLSELKRVLAESSEAQTDAALLVSVNCASTKFRKVVELSPTDDSAWDGEVTIQRDDVRSVVELRPLLVRRTAIPDPDDGGGAKATKKGAILAEGRGLRLYVDEIRRPIHGALKIQWENFRESEYEWLNERSDDLFFLEPRGDEPRLWLNSSYEALEPTLLGTDRAGVDAALRHLTNGMIAQTVWIQLFLIAASEVLRDDVVEGEVTIEGWKGDVLSNFLPRLFPEAQTDEDRKRRLKEMLNSPHQYGTLMALTGTAAQQVVGSGELFVNAVRAVEEVNQQ